MFSLVIETSTDFGLVALLRENQVLRQCQLPGGPDLSKSLGLEVKNVLDGMVPDRMVVGIGPGSFTGTRVGASMAQALAFGWQKPLFVASSLTGFAPEAPNFAVAVDARSGGLYVQVNFEAPKLISLAEAQKELERAGLVASPHPKKILERIPLSVRWVETRPNPLLLSQNASPAPTPFRIEYLEGKVLFS